MFINQYITEEEQGLSFTRQQASDFAKNIADDFNPLHDIEAKRFCVPGDLLFSTILARAGIHQSMTFNFSGMVNDGIILDFPSEIEAQAKVTDTQGKEYLAVEVEGQKTHCETLVESLIRSYVGFSGRAFPHILVELMAQNNVMINPARPMIIYESMHIDLERLDIDSIDLTLTNASLDVQEKRGKAILEFSLLHQGQLVGKGVKHMVLSGLRPYDKAVMDAVVEDYNQWKVDYHKAG